MAEKLDLLLEAERRGILPAEKQPLLDEARRRGLVNESTASDKVKQFAYGANTELANVFDAPQAIADTLLGPAIGAMGGQRFQPGDNPLSEFLRQGEDIPPQTSGERVARRVGREIGATVPYAALPYAIPAQKATGAVSGGVQAMRAGVANAPAQAAIGETVAALGSGAGAGAAGEAFPGNPSAEMAGQLIGGITPTALTMGPVGIAGRAGRAVARRVSPGAQTRAAKAHVSDLLKDTDISRGLSDAETLSQQISGFQPSLAESTGAPSLVSTQRRFESQATGQELEGMAGRRQANVEAVEQYGARERPEGGLPEDVTDAARANTNKILESIRSERDVNVAQQERLAGSLEIVDRSQSGAALRERINELKSQSSAEMSRLADRLGLNDTDVSIPFGNLRDEILESTLPGSVFEDAANRPDVLKSIEGVRGAEGANQPVVTFQDYMALRSRIGDDLRDAVSSSTPSAKKIRELTRLRSVVDDGFNKIIAEADPALAENYRAFRQAYREKHIERFEQGAAFKVRQRDGRNFYRVPDEKVAESFFRAGDVSSAQQFKRIFGEESGPLASVALDNLRDAAVRDGKLDKTLFNTWLRKHDSVLNEFPDVKKVVGDIEGAAAQLADRNATLTTRLRKVEDLRLVRDLEQVAQGRPPEEVIRLALKSPKRMRTLLRRVRGDKEAGNSLKRHLWDEALSGDTGKFIDTNRRTLEMALGSVHLNNLEAIVKARGMIDRIPAPIGKGFKPDPTETLTRELGQGVPQIASRVFAVKSGRIGAKYMATDMLGRLVRGRSILESEQLLKEALYDPQVARELRSLLYAKGAKPEIARRLNVRLINLGLASRDDE